MTPPTEDNHLLRIGLAQIAPVWLDRERTILKVKTYVERASEQGCHMVAFGEALGGPAGRATIWNGLCPMVGRVACRF
jgi:predicted amidohydrolase